MGLALGAGMIAGARSMSTSVPVIVLVAVVVLLAMTVVLYRRALPLVACAVCGAAVAIAVGIVSGVTDSQEHPLPSGQYLTARVETDPRVGRTGSHARIAWAEPHGTSGTALIYFPAGYEAMRGDLVRASGRVSLDGDEPLFFADPPRVLQSPSRMEQVRRTVRRHAEMSMITHVPGSPGSLTLGLLIGNDTALSSDERQNLRASGLAHITAVSGWNVSVVVIAVGSVFRAFGARGWRWLLVQLAFLGGYVWIVGLEPPIVRAAIMGAVALCALQIGRPSHMVTHLLIAAGLMAAHNPHILESLSFQLSFMSMMGLAAATWLCRDLDGWRQAVLTPAVTAAVAGLATAPLLGAAFGSLPLMTVPANLLAAPFVPIATFLGVAVVLTAWTSILAEPLGWLSWIVASTILGISRFFANIPGGHHQFAPLGSASTVLLYALLALAATPCFPDGRALGRKVQLHMYRNPASAFATGAVTVVVLGIGLLAIG